jgi:hypothetical protein
MLAALAVTEGSGDFYPEKFAAFGRNMQAKDVIAHAIVLISAKGDAQVQIARALSEATAAHTTRRPPTATSA